MPADFQRLSRLLSLSAGARAITDIGNTGTDFDSSGGLGLVAGAVGTPPLYFGGDNTTGIFRQAANVLGIAVSGAEDFRIEANIFRTLSGSRQEWHNSATLADEVFRMGWGFVTANVFYMGFQRGAGTQRRIQIGLGNVTDALSIIQEITDTVTASFAYAGGLDMKNNPITNIGAAGTDFSATGGLTLADALVLPAGVKLQMGFTGGTQEVLENNVNNLQIANGAIDIVGFGADGAADRIELTVETRMVNAELWWQTPGALTGAQADIVASRIVDIAGGDARLGIQSELGSAIYIGNNQLRFSSANGSFFTESAGVARSLTHDISVVAGGAANAQLSQQFQLDSVFEAGLSGETNGAAGVTAATQVWKVPYRDSGAAVAAPAALNVEVLGGMRVEAGDDVNRVYFRANEAWHYINQTAGLSITAEERTDPWTGHRWEVGDLALVRMHKAYGDGGADFLPYPFEEGVRVALTKLLATDPTLSGLRGVGG